MKRIMAASTLGVLVATSAGMAFASVTVMPGTYSGHLAIAATETVNFTVKGSKVTRMRVGVFPPNRCGSGGPTPKQRSGPARIHNGSFTATVAYGSGKGAATTVVTGTFLAGGKEMGFVTSGKGISKPCRVHDRYATTRA